MESLGGNGQDVVEEDDLETRVVLDIEGQELEVIDPHERSVMRNAWHVEACCKQLVHTRMKRNGQRWKRRGGQAILTLRKLATDAG